MLEKFGTKLFIKKWAQECEKVSIIKSYKAGKYFLFKNYQAHYTHHDQLYGKNNQQPHSLQCQIELRWILKAKKRTHGNDAELKYELRKDCNTCR